jgi:DNA-binding transcriptional LysR family regulator
LPHSITAIAQRKRHLPAIRGAARAYAFELDGSEIEIDPAGPLIINDNDHMIEAAKRGIGLAFVFRSSVSDDLDAGTLQEVLSDWSTQFPGFFLYYARAAAAHRQMPLKLRVFIEALQKRA